MQIPLFSPNFSPIIASFLGLLRFVLDSERLKRIFDYQLCKIVFWSDFLYLFAIAAIITTIQKRFENQVIVIDHFQWLCRSVVVTYFSCGFKFCHVFYTSFTRSCQIHPIRILDIIFWCRFFCAAV